MTYYVRAQIGDVLVDPVVQAATAALAIDEALREHWACVVAAGVWVSQESFLLGARPLARWLTIEGAAAAGLTIALRPGAWGGVVID
jgi:hypothetical protein